MNRKRPSQPRHRFKARRGRVREIRDGYRRASRQQSRALAGSGTKHESRYPLPALADARRSWWRRPRFWLGVFTSLALCALLTGWLIYRAYATLPGYWLEHQAFMARFDVPRQEALAERLQNRLPAELSEIRPPGSEQRALVLAHEEVGSWLARRLPEVLEHQGMRVPGLGRVMFSAVTFPPETDRSPRLTLAADVGTAEASRVISLQADLLFLADRRAALREVDLWVGRLPLPRGWLANRVRSAADRSPRPEALVLLAEVLEGAPFEPVVKVDRMRQVRITDLQADTAGYYVQLTTEPREEATPD